jgi:hypothetical protein
MDRFALGHAALTHALQVLASEAPTAAERASHSLMLLLEGVYHSHWKEIAWLFSTLTTDGFPVEFAFSSVDRSLRYVTEVVGPEADETTVLSQALQRLAQLGAPPLPPEMYSLLCNVQGSGPLRYGAWVGGRHGLHDDSYKLYAEVPETDAPEVRSLLCTLLRNASPLSTRATPFLMVGYDFSSSRTELYFKADGLEPWEVGFLLRKHGLGSREKDLLGLVEETYGRSIEQRLPTSRMGFSLSLAPDGPLVFSLFASARSLFGGDGSIRRHLLALAEKRGWNLESYARLSESLAMRTSWVTNHGVVSFVVAPHGPPMLHIGLRPPAIDSERIPHC